MAYDYNKLKKTSQDLINRFGRTIDIKLVTKVNDTINGTVTETVETIPVKGVVTEYKDKEIDGTIIKATDYRILIAPNSKFDKIRPDALLVTNTKTYRVIREMQVAPGDTVLLHDVQARI